MQAQGAAHFNCPTLQGVEVENQGGTGTAISHWEKRILEVSTLIAFGNKKTDHELYFLLE